MNLTRPQLQIPCGLKNLITKGNAVLFVRLSWGQRNQGAYLTPGSVFRISVHTPAGLLRPASPLHAGSSLPCWCSSSSFLTLLCPWAVFSDLTQVTSSVTGASHPHHGNRQHLVSGPFHGLMKGRRKDIFSFPLQSLSSSQELSPFDSQTQFPGAMSPLNVLSLKPLPGKQRLESLLAQILDQWLQTSRKCYPWLMRRELRLDFTFLYEKTLFRKPCFVSSAISHEVFSFKLTFNFRKLLHLINSIQFESRIKLLEIITWIEKEGWLLRVTCKGFDVTADLISLTDVKLEVFFWVFWLPHEVDGWLTVLLIKEDFKTVAIPDLSLSGMDTFLVKTQVLKEAHSFKLEIHSL